MDQEQDAAEGTVGHMRFDFGGGGFYHSWWPHNEDRFNTPEFKAALQEFVDEMRVRGPMKGEASMNRWCYRHPAGELESQRFGFIAESADYRFCLRCTTMRGDYSYVYCYDLNQQRLAMAEKHGLTEEGRRQLQNAADPGVSHAYIWYMIENINDSESRVDHFDLTLEDAVRLYAASDCGDKRLGVTKDGIASVDLAIRYDGREWISEDWLESETFAEDPVVADAAAMLQQSLEEQAAVQDTQSKSMEMGGM